MIYKTFVPRQWLINAFRDKICSLILEVLPLLVASGAVGVYYYMTSRDYGNTNTSPSSDLEQTGPIDYSTLAPYLMPDEAGVSSTHTANVVAKTPQMDALGQSTAELENVHFQARQLEDECMNLIANMARLEDELQQVENSFTCVLTASEKIKRETLAEAERRCKEAMDSNTYLKRKNIYLMSKVNILKDKLSLTQISHNDVMMDYEQEVEAYTTLKATLVELERKYLQVMKSNLMLQNEKLHDLVLDMKNKYSESENDALTQSTAQLESIHSQAHHLEDECMILIANMGRLENELQQVENTFTRVQTASEEIKRDNKNEHRSLTVTMESSTLLQRENSELMFQVKTLQRSMSQLKEELFEVRRQNKEMEQGQQQGTSRIKQLQLDPASLTEVDMYLIAKLTETENKLTRAIRYAAMFEQERADLRYHIRVLQSSVHELEQMLSDAERKCDVTKQEKDQAMETLNMLRMQCTRIHQTFPQCNDLVTSLSEDLEPKKDDLMNPT